MKCDNKNIENNATPIFVLLSFEMLYIDINHVITMVASYNVYLMFENDIGSKTK